MSLEYMAGRSSSLRLQGITGRALIGAVGLVSVVLVTRVARAQQPPTQPPPAAYPPPPATQPPPAPQQPPAAPPAQQPPPAAQQPPAQTPPSYPPYPPAPNPYPQQPYPYAPQYPQAQYPAPAYPPAAYPPPAPAAYPPPPPTAYPPPAYPPTAYPPPAGTLTSYAAPPLTPSPRPPVVDPQGDRVVLLPTATTHPAGTFYFSNYELLVFQLGYAFTDSTQMSVTAIPIPSESVTALDISLKSSVYRRGRVRAAAIGSATGVVGKDVGLEFLGRAGAVVQVCLARQCESSLSLSTNALLVGTLLMVNGAGGIFRVSDHVSLLAELATMLPVGKQGGQFNGGLVGGGVRLHYSHFGVDFTALHVLDSGEDVTTIPFFAMTWRY